jgi:hypothetical protein
MPMKRYYLSGPDLVQYQIQNRRRALAPWIAGCALDIFGAGILASLLVRYFMGGTVRRPGSRKVTITLCVVAILSTFKTAAALYILFLNAVILSGDNVRLAVAEIQDWVCPNTFKLIPIIVS